MAVAVMAHRAATRRDGASSNIWDRGEPDGDLLTRYAKEWGGYDLYIGDDGLIYGSK